MGWQCLGPAKKINDGCVAVRKCAEEDASWSEQRESRIASKPHGTL